LELSATSIAEAFTVAFEDVLISGINQAIDAAEAALARMPQIGDYAPDFGGDGGGGGGGGDAVQIIDPITGDRSAISGTVANAISQGLRNSPIPISGTVLSGIQSTMPVTPISNTPSFGPYVPGSGGVPESTRIVNIYTQSSTRETANAQAQLNSKTGSSRTTTSVRALADYAVG